MFRKYMKIRRLGHPGTTGILDGLVYVFPKLDGANASVWWDNGIHLGTRNREIYSGGKGLYEYIVNNKNIENLLSNYQHLIIYGEWLVPHTIKTYKDDAWNKFYVFDVYDLKDNRFLQYEEYTSLLDEYGVKERVLCLGVLEAPDETELIRFLDNTFLIKANQGFGEGIVIKRYDFINKYGRTIWAKIVRREFKENKIKDIKKNDNSTIEEKIVNMLDIELLVDKTKSKVLFERNSDTFVSEYTGELIGRVWHDVIEDEIWSILKKYRNPTINFKKLNKLVTNRIKEVL